jgi:hypothetical protein
MLRIPENILRRSRGTVPYGTNLRIMLNPDPIELGPYFSSYTSKRKTVMSIRIRLFLFLVDPDPLHWYVDMLLKKEGNRKVPYHKAFFLVVLLLEKIFIFAARAE